MPVKSGFDQPERSVRGVFPAQKQTFSDQKSRVSEILQKSECSFLILRIPFHPHGWGSIRI
jgi:hypothetical protein